MTSPEAFARAEARRARSRLTKMCCRDGTVTFSS
jgi:hypothetical protein